MTTACFWKSPADPASALTTTWLVTLVSESQRWRTVLNLTIYLVFLSTIAICSGHHSVKVQSRFSRMSHSPWQPLHPPRPLQCHESQPWATAPNAEPPSSPDSGRGRAMLWTAAPNAPVSQGKQLGNFLQALLSRLRHSVVWQTLQWPASQGPSL